MWHFLCWGTDPGACRVQIPAWLHLWQTIRSTALDIIYSYLPNSNNSLPQNNMAHCILYKIYRLLKLVPLPMNTQDVEPVRQMRCTTHLPDCCKVHYAVLITVIIEINFKIWNIWSTFFMFLKLFLMATLRLFIAKWCAFAALLQQHHN